MKSSLVIFILLIAYSAYSQKNEIGFSGGVSAGIIMAQVDGDNYEGYNRMGPQAGIFSKYRFNDDFSLHTEIKYIQKGSKKSSQKQNIYFEFKLDYVEIPILLEYKIRDKFWVQAGLGIAYLVSAKVDQDGYGFTEPPRAFEVYELSGIGGVYYFLADNIYISATASYSILPVLPHPGSQVYYTDRGCHNNIVGASLNYIF